VAEVFRCGHPRSPENTAKNGGKSSTACKQCKSERARGAYQSRLPGRSAPELAGHGQRGCDVEGCRGIHLARGLCRRHYAERKRRGSIGSAPAAAAPCSEHGCDRPAAARSLCKAHYTRARNAGMPRVQQINAGAECSEPGCGQSAHARGQCQAHFNYWRAIERYGVDRAGYDRLVAAQGGRCAICGTADPGPGYERWSIDHDHACCPGSESCGHCVRGLLCRNCNVGLGHFDDDPDRLLAATAYLLSRADVLRMAGGERP